MTSTSITSATPGNLVVPLSAIISQLQGKLSSADLNALLLSVVGNRQSTVSPGDLITADLINQMLSDISDLSTRVAALEGASVGNLQVVISRVLPDGPLVIGSQIQILGQNFGFSIGAVRVFFGTVAPASFDQGSNDSVLIMEVPNVANATTTPMPIVLTVSNATTSATVTVTIKRADTPVTGDVDVMPGGVTPDPVVAGQPASFAYTLTSHANQTAAFAVTPTLKGQSWPVSLIGADGNALSNPLSLDPRVPVGVTLRMSIPGTADKAPFDLVLAVQSGAAGGDSGVTSYVVGTSNDQDSSITFATPSVDPPSSYSNGTITLAAGVQNSVSMLVSSTNDDYDLALSFVKRAGDTAAATGWLAGWVSPPPVDATHVTQASTTITNGAGLFKFAVEPQAGASTSGRLQLSVQRKGAQFPALFNFELQLG